MSFTKKQLRSGTVAEAEKVNSNFLEIYQELENFPTENGSLNSAAISTAKIQDGAVVFSKISPSAYLTSSADASSASDDTLITSKAVVDYLRSVM
jgi:hypothetical protein